MADTMQAWVLQRPAPLAEQPLLLERVPVPEPGPGQVRVRVRVCAVCRTDLHVVEGDLPMRRPRVIPGHQVVGVIDAVGPAVPGAPIPAALPAAHRGAVLCGDAADATADGADAADGVDVGEVADAAARAVGPALVPGQRVGVAWLHRTCGTCAFCRSGRENLCDHPDFTGWTVPGGYAEYVVVPAAFAYPLPHGFDDVQAAPLLCAGIIGQRALRLTGLGERGDGGFAGRSLGIWGFGAAGHVVIQLARARGAEVYVCTRDRARHQALARELGAAWVGDSPAAPPVPLDAGVVFAPAGELVPPALRALAKGGTLVLGGIHMSQIPPLDYEWLYGERVVRSVANNTRQDGREFLAEAAAIPVHTHVRRFPFAHAPEALAALKDDAIRGAAVLMAP